MRIFSFNARAQVAMGLALSPLAAGQVIIATLGNRARESRCFCSDSGTDFQRSRFAHHFAVTEPAAPSMDCVFWRNSVQSSVELHLLVTRTENALCTWNRPQAAELRALAHFSYLPSRTSARGWPGSFRPRPWSSRPVDSHHVGDCSGISSNLLLRAADVTSRSGAG